MKPTTIKIQDIKIKFFVRTGLNLENIKYLRDLYESEDPVQPIEVVKLEDNSYELIDGRHRIEAAKEAGFTSIQAIISKDLDDKTKILNAVLANIGGALPQTLADFEHSIELLINLKMSRKEILESYPLPTAITAKYYKQTQDKIYKRVVRKAVEEILKGKISVNEAAVKFKVDLKDLQWFLNYKNSQQDSNIDSFIKNLSYSVRSVSGKASKESKIILELFERGELGRNDVARFIKHLKDSLRKINNTFENSKARLEIALKTLSKEISKDEFTSQVLPLSAKEKS